MINSMAAVRCEFRPGGELRMMPGIKAQSTEGFSLYRNSSYSISLIRLWLCGSYISTMDYQESGMGSLRSERREQLIYGIVLI